VKEMVTIFLVREKNDVWDFIGRFHQRNDQNHSGGTRAVQKEKAERGKRNIPEFLGLEEDVFNVLNENALIGRATNISDYSTSNLSP
jgi:hypothetical protein